MYHVEENHVFSIVISLILQNISAVSLNIFLLPADLKIMRTSMKEGQCCQQFLFKTSSILNIIIIIIIIITHV